MSATDRLSWQVLKPVSALSGRALRRRWWRHTKSTSDEPVEDVLSLAGRPGDADRQAFEDGVGAVVRREYSITFPSGGMGPDKVMEWFCGHTEARSPASYARFSDPITHEGQQLVVHLAGPWEGPVEVVSLTPTAVVLATLDGHMEAGWIRFSADADTPGQMSFRIDSAARAGDPMFWLLHAVAKVGQLVQTDMWATLLESAATEFAGPPAPRVRVTTTTHPTSADPR